MANYLFFDIESPNAERRWEMDPADFMRTFQYAWNDDEEVRITTSHEEALSLLRTADYVVGHNIIAFDLTAVFGKDSIEPLKMAQDKKVLDTFYLSNLLTPAPYSYKDSKGHTYRDAAKPENAMKWLSLENLCFQFGLPGKFGSLKEIAKKYQPEGTRVADYDYGLIPLNDLDFDFYARQDVIAVRALFKHLQKVAKEQAYPGSYIWREMELMSATVGQMARNGILVNQEYASQRLLEAAQTRENLLTHLVAEYDFPASGKSPWASAKGKEAIIRILADHGITPETHEWPRTPTGALKLGGNELIELTSGTDAEEFGRSLAELKGQRSTSQLVLDSMYSDGRVHPEISSLQRSGRWSFSKPGVTIFGDRTEKLKQDKSLFTSAPGKVLAGFDFSNADPRAMAALSGDPEYGRRFTELDPTTGEEYDGHNLTGEALFGQDLYYQALDKKGKPVLRPIAKLSGNGLNYSMGAYKLAVTLNAAAKKEGLEVTFWAPAPTDRDTGKLRAPEIPKYEDSLDTRDMVGSFNTTYPWLKLFKDNAVKEAQENGYVTNSWGRRMYVDKGREWTQAPALYGQGSVREVMGDAILALCRRGDYYARAIRAIIHDELLLELDEDRIEEDIKVVKECMETVFDPKTAVGAPIEFKVGYGVGKTWKDAGH